VILYGGIGDAKTYRCAGGVVVDDERVRQCRCDLLPERSDRHGCTAGPGGAGGLCDGRRQDTGLLALNLPGVLPTAGYVPETGNGRPEAASPSVGWELRTINWELMPTPGAPPPNPRHLPPSANSMAGEEGACVTRTRRETGRRSRDSSSSEGVRLWAVLKKGSAHDPPPENVESGCDIVGMPDRRRARAQRLRP
jgi:hypothetical protein